MEDNNCRYHIHILHLAQIQCNWLRLHDRSTYDLLPLHNLRTFLYEAIKIYNWMSSNNYHNVKRDLAWSLYYNSRRESRSMWASASIFQFTDWPHDYMGKCQYIPIHRVNAGVYCPVLAYSNSRTDCGSIWASVSIFQLTEQPQKYIGKC